MKTATRPTFRLVRPGAYVVERGGHRIGSLYQRPINSERDALRWEYWPVGESAWPTFRSFEEAEEAILDL